MGLDVADMDLTSELGIISNGDEEATFVQFKQNGVVLPPILLGTIFNDDIPNIVNQKSSFLEEEFLCMPSKFPHSKSGTHSTPGAILTRTVQHDILKEAAYKLSEGMQRSRKSRRSI